MTKVSLTHYYVWHAILPLCVMGLPARLGPIQYAYQANSMYHGSIVVHLSSNISIHWPTGIPVTRNFLFRVLCRGVDITCSVGWNGRFIFKRPSIRIIIFVFWKCTMHFNKVNVKKIALPSSKSNFRTFLCRAMFIVYPGSVWKGGMGNEGMGNENCGNEEITRLTQIKYSRLRHQGY